MIFIKRAVYIPCFVFRHFVDKNYFRFVICKIRSSCLSFSYEEKKDNRYIVKILRTKIRVVILGLFCYSLPSIQKESITSNMFCWTLLMFLKSLRVWLTDLWLTLQSHSLRRRGWGVGGGGGATTILRIW